MSLLVLFPILGFSVSGYLVVHFHQRGWRSASRRTQGMADVVMLRRLLELLPQHRGMANALLQGDDSFRNKLTCLQADIDAALRPLAALLEEGDPWAVGPRAGRVQDGWNLIKRQLAEFKPAESFARHTELATEQLYLINDIADAAGLLETTADDGLMDAVVNQLPLVTEALGQARGMGTGVAVRGKCTIDMRVKLRYLHDNTQRVTAEVAAGLRSTLQGDAVLRSRAAEALEASQQASRPRNDS